MRILSSLLATVTVLALLAMPKVATADEVIELIDKTRIVGKLVHYYDGVLTVKLPTGAKMKLPAAKVRRLMFKLPKPRAAFSSPRKVFKRLRSAALRGDLRGYIDCHSTYYQMMLNHQVALAKPGKFAAQLKRQWGEVQLKVVSSKIKGATATMRVRSAKGGQTRDGEFRFVKENGEWKMVLPL